MGTITKVGFLTAMKNFFGYRAGDTMKDFKGEMDALTLEDKTAYHTMLVESGVDCDPPKK